MNRLVRCIHCDEVFCRTPFDRDPEYAPQPSFPPVPSPVIERDDFGDFLRNHDGHRLEELTIIQDSFVSEKDYVEPVKASYFKATNGRESFVIKKFRKAIADPLTYQLIHGDYRLECISLEIQSEAIAKQLRYEFKSIPLAASKVEAFLRLYRRVAQGMDVERLERVSEESSNPLQVYFIMDEVSLMFLLRNCRNIFEGQQYNEIEAFIQRQREDGVLLLKANYRLEIIEKARAKSRTLPVGTALKIEKAKENI